MEMQLKSFTGDNNKVALIKQFEVFDNARRYSFLIFV